MRMTTFKCFIYQFCKLDFIKTKVDLQKKNSNLQMIWTIFSSTSFMNLNKQTINKLFLASWRHNLIVGFLSLSYAMTLKA
jgi:hypothetical protein